MARHLFLFLSLLNAAGKEIGYTAPDGKTYKGTLSNAAPVSYLLANFEVDDVICVVTREALNSGAGEELAPVLGSHTLYEVAYNEKDGPFDGEPLREILDHFSPGDTLVMDATGGPRTFMMYFVQISHLLSYLDVKTEEVVYANLGGKTIESAISTFDMSERADALNDLMSFGSATRLRAFAVSHSLHQTIQDLMQKMDTLTLNISVCHIDKIDQMMAELKKTMDEAEKCEELDTLSRAMLRVFSIKFNGEMTIFGMIRWCLNNNLIQQAIAIFVEKLPRILFTGVKEGYSPLLKTERSLPKNGNGVNDVYKDYLTEILSFDRNTSFLSEWIGSTVTYDGSAMCVTEAIKKWLRRGEGVNKFLDPLNIKEGDPGYDAIRSLLIYLRAAYKTGYYNPAWRTRLNDNGRLKEKYAEFEKQCKGGASSGMPGIIDGFFASLKNGLSKNALEILGEDNIALDIDEEKFIGSMLTPDHLAGKQCRLKDGVPWQDLLDICVHYTEIRHVRNHASHAAGNGAILDRDTIIGYKGSMIRTMEKIEELTKGK